MKSLLLALVILLSSMNAWAESLELSYIQPSPTKAFMWSVVAPGGGLFYLGSNCGNSKYTHQGLLYLISEVAIIAWGTHSAGEGAIIPASLLFTGIKIIEFNTTIDSAEKEHHINLTNGINFKLGTHNR